MDMENMRAQFILCVLSEVDEYFINEYGTDNRFDMFTPDNVINSWLYMYANINLEELKEMCNELIHDDNDAHDTTDSENEFDFEFEHEFEELPIG
jgi:hypothetical protein